MAGIRQFADSHECHCVYDCDSYHSLQIQVLQSHTWLADHKLPIVAFDVLHSVLRVSVSKPYPTIILFTQIMYSILERKIIIYFYLQTSIESI